MATLSAVQRKYTYDKDSWVSTIIFSVGECGELTITDDSEGKAGKICDVEDKPCISIKGGNETINGGSVNFKADTISNPSGCVGIGGYGSFSMSGGTITKNNMGMNINSASAWMMVTGCPVIACNTDKDVKQRWDVDNSTLSTIYINEKLGANAFIGIGTKKQHRTNRQHRKRQSLHQRNEQCGGLH